MDEQIQKRFIVEDDQGSQNIEEQTKRVLPFGRITKEGLIIIDNRSLSKLDQLKLCLIIRHIANFYVDEISREVRAVELVKTLDQRIEAIGASLSFLASEGFAKKVDRGRYLVFPYKISAFLDHLESIGSESSSGKNKTGRRKGNALTGIGRHIQRLIDEGFFQEPRLIAEVMAELKKENIIRDSRVVDKSIRDSFVSMRRSLQRIPNEDGGKATWKYMIRK